MSIEVETNVTGSPATGDAGKNTKEASGGAGPDGGAGDTVTGLVSVSTTLSWSSRMRRLIS